MSTNAPARLGILIGAPHGDQSSMHNDLVAMYQTLKRRGLTSEEIICLEGALNRRLLLEFMSAIHRQIADWVQGELFLYVTGHGFFDGDSAHDARVGVLLRVTENVGDEYHTFWDQLFQALSAPQGVAVTVLPDH
jgi:hypothetical protein